MTEYTQEMIDTLAIKVMGWEWLEPNSATMHPGCWFNTVGGFDKEYFAWNPFISWADFGMLVDTFAKSSEYILSIEIFQTGAKVEVWQNGIIRYGNIIGHAPTAGSTAVYKAICQEVEE